MTHQSPTPFYDNYHQIIEELLQFTLGPFIGEGEHRAVYEVPGDEELVYKININHNEKRFCNVSEWNTWEAIKDTPAAKWFAPCYSISHSGNILVQARTKPISEARFPKLVPHYLGDTHIYNWGIYKNRPVMHDYGFIDPIIDRGLESKKPRMVKNKRIS